MHNDELPKSVGKYHLQSRLAAGGMGRVFLALDPDGCTVAIKQLHPAIAHDSGMRERLRREVAAMRRVRSDRVARLLDADLDADPPYIVTRYIQGRTLHDVVDADGPLRGERLLRVAQGVAEALAAIHDAGHVHRDLKPANVMLVAGDPVVIDFGIAQELGATRITQEGGAIGTIGYMAPEVLDGAPAGPPADAFAWGATIAYAATGRPAFGGGAFQSVAWRTYRGDADLEGIDDRLHPILEAALAPDPDARPDIGAVIHAITQAPSEQAPLSSRRVSRKPPADPLTQDRGGAVRVTPPPRGKRMWIPIGLLSVALAVLSAFVIIRDVVKDRRPEPLVLPQMPRSAPARPSYTGQIANWGPGKRFEKFLENNVGKKVYIGASLSDEIIPQSSSSDAYDPSNSNQNPYFVFWTSCFKRLIANEEPTGDKCLGFQVTIIGEQPALTGLRWAHGLYSVMGNFEVFAGATYQGVGTFTLKPTEAA